MAVIISFTFAGFILVLSIILAIRFVEKKANKPEEIKTDVDLSTMIYHNGQLIECFNALDYE